VLVPVGPVALESGHLYEIEVREADEPALGSGQAILRFLKSMPKLPPEDIDAMEKAIETGQALSQDKPLFVSRSVSPSQTDIPKSNVNWK
jgi:hypothetical protein